jgi:hypothetical protein
VSAGALRDNAMPPAPDVVFDAYRVMHPEWPPWVLGPLIGAPTPLPAPVVVPSAVVIRGGQLSTPRIRLKPGCPWDAFTERLFREGWISHDLTFVRVIGDDGYCDVHAPYDGWTGRVSYHRTDNSFATLFASHNVVWESPHGWRNNESPADQRDVRRQVLLDHAPLQRVRTPEYRDALLTFWLGHPAPHLAALGMHLLQDRAWRPSA